MMKALDLLQNKTIVLGSASPRRRQIFQELGLPYRVMAKSIDEDYPAHLRAGEIPLYLSRQKADALRQHVADNEILVTADTIVWINDSALNKPEGREEARKMLETISGCSHSVFTGVTIAYGDQSHSFWEETRVHFHPLDKNEIEYYLDRHKPYDKAGAYGIQEFIGYIGIARIEGDFYNVMGFPVQRFWRELPPALSPQQ
ncbi:MAG: Maf-like protein [Salibacteraceae bacterium]